MSMFRKPDPTPKNNLAGRPLPPPPNPQQQQRKYLTRCDRLNQENQVDKIRWGKPDIELGKRILFRNSMRKWNHKTQSFENLPLSAGWDDIMGFGTGVSLFFRWFKQLTVVMFIMSILAGASVYQIYASPFLKPAEISTPLDYTTIANLGLAKSLGPNGDYSIVSDPLEIVDVENRRVAVYLLDILMTVVFFLYVVVQRLSLPSQVRRCQHEVVTVSDYSVEVRGIPPDCTLADISALCKPHGATVEIFIARDYKGHFERYKGVAALELEERKTLGLIQLGVMGSSGQRVLQENKAKAIEAKQSAQQAMIDSGLSIRTHDDFPASRAYIIFNQVVSRTSMLKQFDKENIKRRRRKLCCQGSATQGDVFVVKNKPVTLKIPDEPSNIRFENLGIKASKKLTRRALAILFIMAFIIIVFLAMYAVSRLSGFRSTTNCRNVSTLEEIDTSGTQDSIYCFCAKRSMSELAEEKILNHCRGYLLNRTYQIALNVIIALAVLIVATVIRVVVNGLAAMMLFTKVSDEMTTITLVIFCSDIINYILLTVFLRGQFLGFNLSGWLAQLLEMMSPSLAEKNTLYDKFNSAWYLDIGAKVMNRFVLDIFIPHIFNFIVLPFWRCVRMTKASHAQIQEDVIKQMKGNPFRITSVGSKVLSQIFLTLAFCPGMPILVILCFIFLLVLYWITKWGAFRYYNKPPMMDESFAVLTSKLMTLALLIHCAMAITLFRASEVFNVPEKYNLPPELHSKLSYIGVNLDYRNYAFYYGVGLICLVWLGWDFLLKPCLKFFFVLDCCSSKVDNSDEAQQVVGSRRAKKASRVTFNDAFRILGMSSSSSYDVKRNPDYRDVFMAMDFTLPPLIREPELERPISDRSETLNSTNATERSLLAGNSFSKVHPTITRNPSKSGTQLSQGTALLSPPRRLPPPQPPKLPQLQRPQTNMR
jgi:hypothetical protein